jgi:hypothetical protein
MADDTIEETQARSARMQIQDMKKKIKV